MHFSKQVTRHHCPTAVLTLFSPLSYDPLDLKGRFGIPLKKFSTGC